MKRPVLFAALIVFLASAVVAGQHNGDSKEGKKLFLTFCSACHGSGGSGDGEASQFLEKKPRDLTNQRIMFKKTDKELFDFINQSKTNFHGARFIPQFRLEFEESQVWDIVAYIRSLSEQSRGNAINGRGLYVAHCASCHGADGKGKTELSESFEIAPSDLTDDKSMSKITDRELYLAVAEGGRSIHGPSIMPQWANRLSPDQTWDVVAYLRMLHRRPVYSGDAGRGSQTFAENCSYCHGGDGKGNTPIAKAFTAPLPDFTNRSQMASWTELDIYIAILGGGDAVGHSEFMPSWGEVLSDNDIWNLVAFIKSLGNNPAP
jgi:mono/diheme cytochrome c family protein